jgi:ABC-type branched-subunit amino acid transport system permease subunit
MATETTPAQSPSTTTASVGAPWVWGARVALLLAVFDLFPGDKIPLTVYQDLQSPSLLYHDTLGLVGELVVLASVVVLAGLFPYLLTLRPGWYSRRLANATISPTLAAASAVSTILLLWAACVVVFSFILRYDGKDSFADSGAVLFVLLLNVIGCMYAGFMAARGDRESAQRAGAQAGFVCGLLVALAWSAYDFGAPFAAGNLDLTFATFAAVARLLVLPVLGYVAGRYGGQLWTLQGAARPRPAAAPRAAGPRGFRLGGGVIWGAVGLLLVAIFYTNPVVAGEVVQFVGSALRSWVVLLVTAVVLVLLVVGVRRAGPLWRPAVRAVWSGVLWLLAIGGGGTRLRSRGLRRLLLSLGLALVFFWPYLDVYLAGSGSDARISVLADTGYYVILALGLNVVVGFAGLLDLGYVAFFAIGSYAWAMLGAPQVTAIVGQFRRLDNLSFLPAFARQLPFGVPWATWFWPSLLIGALVAAFFGVLLGAPTLRLRGDYLAIVTLGFGEIVPIAFKNLTKLTNGTNGVTGVPTPLVPGLEFPLFSATPYYYIILLLVGFAILANVRLRDSRLGRAWVALREDEIATAAAGVNTVRTKLLAFATGAFFAGVAGVFESSRNNIISPEGFKFSNSIIYLAMVVLGGIGSIPGVILGAVVIAVLNSYILNNLDVWKQDPSNVLNHLTNQIPALQSLSFANIRFMIFGGILVLMMLVRPEGLIPDRRRAAELHHDAADDSEGPMLSSLDSAIGGPDYVEERVE